jgi:RNA polymerase sigma-70 factor (ECF subfamily)
MDLETLLELARGGDCEAWDNLLRRLRPYVQTLLRRRVGNAADASDLVQDVQVRMNAGFSGFRGESAAQLLAWVRRIAANVFYDYLARRGPPLEPLPPDLAGPRRIPGTPAIDSEDMARLAEALAELPEHYRVVIEARLFEGLSCVAIGRRLGCPAGTVRIISMRAVQRLSARLRQEP